ncbi:hypothetical protein P3T40_004607 [Paraburkholderia sp. EB58]|jgi:hypothetical protein
MTFIGLRLPKDWYSKQLWGVGRDERDQGGSSRS